MSREPYKHVPRDPAQQQKAEALALELAQEAADRFKAAGFMPVSVEIAVHEGFQDPIIRQTFNHPDWANAAAPMRGWKSGKLA